ncbi:MAG TPA: polysaccharide deacetylase family protein [Vicinamibacteria bacterium]|nr:polysaccharide deacetylase family protein [Vicinamibacteria bacterium]
MTAIGERLARLAPRILLSLGLSASANATAREIAITMDDLPVVLRSEWSIERARQVTRDILSTFQEYGVPATGFVNEQKLEVDGKVDPARVELLERWLEAGLDLGNHGYAHLDLHRVDVSTWEQDILRGERVLRPLIARHGKTLRFFRHPFLHTGLSVAIHDRTSAFLRDHGYRVAPVTIDNQEWMFGFAYAEASSDTEKQRIAEEYLRYMKAIVVYYEEQASAIVGEEIPHILLVHAYALNGDWLGELLGWMRERGYRFVSLEEALKHPAYASEDRYDGPAGITWLHRWALTREMPKSIFGEEPVPPDWIQREN